MIGQEFRLADLLLAEEESLLPKPSSSEFKGLPGRPAVTRVVPRVQQEFGTTGAYNLAPSVGQATGADQPRSEIGGLQSYLEQRDPALKEARLKKEVEEAGLEQQREALATQAEKAREERSDLNELVDSLLQKHGLKPMDQVLKERREAERQKEREKELLAQQGDVQEQVVAEEEPEEEYLPELDFDKLFAEPEKIKDDPQVIDRAIVVAAKLLDTKGIANRVEEWDRRLPELNKAFADNQLGLTEEARTALLEVCWLHFMNYDPPKDGQISPEDAAADNIRTMFKEYVESFATSNPLLEDELDVLGLKTQ